MITKMKYKSIMFLLMGFLLVGTAIGFYEYSDDTDYFVIEKPNIPLELFEDYSEIVDEVFYLDDETHIKTTTFDDWSGSSVDYYNMKEDLQNFAEALDIQGNLETAMGTATYLCLIDNTGDKVGCYAKDYGTLKLFVCEEGISECE
jgi:hypothetical protein